MPFSNLTLIRASLKFIGHFVLCYCLPPQPPSSNGAIVLNSFGDRYEYHYA